MSKAYPGVITADYNNRAMDDLTEADYEALANHLAVQVAACLNSGDPDSDEHDAKYALATTWQAWLTARGWLAAAGKQLDVDTSECVGV